MAYKVITNANGVKIASHYDPIMSYRECPKCHELTIPSNSVVGSCGPCGKRAWQEILSYKKA
jgi:hypothetical protein